MASSTVPSSLLTRRLTRRLFEIANDFDKNKTMKFLVLAPNPDDLRVGEKVFYDRLLGDRSHLVPLEYSDKLNICPVIKPVSFTDSLKATLHDPTLQKLDIEEIEQSMWGVLEKLLPILSCYETNPPSGYLYDEKFEKYASEPVKKYIKSARERIDNSKESPLVKLGSLESGVTLIAHPLHQSAYWRNTIVQIYNYTKNRHATGVILNSYKRSGDVLIREGGTSQNTFNLHLYDSSLKKEKTVEEPTTTTEQPENSTEESANPSPDKKLNLFSLKPLYTNNIAYTYNKDSSIDSEIFTGISFFGEALDEDILKGKWIPVSMEKEMILNMFRFSNLNSMECSVLRRLYWEEILRHLGGEFDGMANLSSNYAKTPYLRATE